MSAPIGPGDFVECVDDRPHDRCGASLLRRGALYLILRVWAPEQTKGRRCSVDVREAPLPQGHSWTLDRFKPIYRPNSHIIESLKRGVPVKEDA